MHGDWLDLWRALRGMTPARSGLRPVRPLAQPSCGPEVRFGYASGETTASGAAGVGAGVAGDGDARLSISHDGAVAKPGRSRSRVLRHRLVMPCASASGSIEFGAGLRRRMRLGKMQQRCSEVRLRRQRMAQTVPPVPRVARGRGGTIPAFRRVESVPGHWKTMWPRVCYTRRS